MRYLRVRNWERFQHYKTGKNAELPPQWIKLHRGLTRNYEFSVLSIAEKGQLMLIWLLAAETNNRFPADSTWVQRMIDSNEDVDLDNLVSLGFLEPCDDPRKILGQSIREEVEKERESKKEHMSADADVSSGRAVVGTETEEVEDGDSALGDRGRGLGDDGGDDPGADAGDLRDGGRAAEEVEAVLAYFDAATGRRFKRTEERRKKVRARLRSWSVHDLCRAADSAAANPFYGGAENKHRTRFDRPQTVYRSDETVEAHLQWWEENAVSSNGGAFDHLD